MRNLTRAYSAVPGIVVNDLCFTQFEPVSAAMSMVPNLPERKRAKEAPSPVVRAANLTVESFASADIRDCTDVLSLKLLADRMGPLPNRVKRHGDEAVGLLAYLWVRSRSLTQETKPALPGVADFTDGAVFLISTHGKIGWSSSRFARLLVRDQYSSCSTSNISTIEGVASPGKS